MSAQFSESKNADPALTAESEGKEARRRKKLLILLVGLLLSLFIASGLLIRYLQQPAPLPELMSLPVEVNYPPHYLFSMYGVEMPVGVALSPDGGRIYVTESGGDRMVKMFDRDGNILGSFAPPRTQPGERAPVYLATDDNERIYVTDRLQHAIFVYDKNGIYFDTILGPDLTLSEYLSKHVDNLEAGTKYSYNVFEPSVYYELPGEGQETLPAPDPINWSPLGIRMDGTGKLFLTDVAGDHHTIREIPGDVVIAASWQDFNPPEIIYGSYGQGEGQFLFPNAAVSDSQGRVYITDGNNGRISVWDGIGNFLFHFGMGSGDDALSLPRGAMIDGRDRLYVVDALGQNVNVYDVSGFEPNFLFKFGDWGLGDGLFNYPNDIALDTSGRLYIADRENNRIQVWSY
jgi:DNA-binding beta-propeller fold protein YncE